MSHSAKNGRLHHRTSLVPDDDGDRDGSDVAYWRTALKDMGQDLSISGLRYASRPYEPLARRVIWVVLITGGLGFMLYQIIMSVTMYYSRPVSVNLGDIYPASLRFPKITICNENFFVRSKVRKLGLESTFEQLYPGWFDPASASLNYTALGLNIDNAYAQNGFTSEEQFQKNMSYTQAEMITGCTFSSVPCSQGLIEEVWTDVGLCYQFNPDSQNIQVTKAGALFGLLLVLDVQQDEYIAQYKYSAGFMLKAGAQYLESTMYVDSVRIPVGGNTEVQVRQTQKTRLEKPYGICTRDRTLRRYSIYTRENCEDECISDYMAANCGCVMMGFKALASETTCSISSFTSCVVPYFFSYVTQNLMSSCVCEPECDSTSYELSVSSSLFSDYSVNYFSQNATQGNYTAEYARKNIAVVEVYFPQISYLKMESQVAYSQTELFNDLGGALGLMLGSTFFTLYEIIDIIIWAAYARQKAKKKVQDSKKVFTPSMNGRSSMPPVNT